ncbi:hypothetical protein MMC14_010108 [Varicellaria rhodocarpa]|nr:hypothetical protein [Varicellaria rhodocarpa]
MGRSQESKVIHSQLRKRKRQALIAKKGLVWAIGVDNPHRKKVLVKGKSVLVKAKRPSPVSSLENEGASLDNSEDIEDTEEIQDTEDTGDTEDVEDTEHTEDREYNAFEIASEENAKLPFFQKIPMDARLMIYEFAMAMKEDIIVGGTESGNARNQIERRITKRPVPNFLYTSRQVLAETKGILNTGFLAVNEFRFTKTYAHDLYLFMERLGKENFHVISFITLSAINTESTSFVFENVTSLKRLRISDSDPSRVMCKKFEHWVPLMRKLCAGSSGVKHIVLDKLIGMKNGLAQLRKKGFKKSTFPTTLRRLENELNNLLEH